MTKRRLLAVALLFFALAVARPARPVAQAIQRSMYVSVLDEAGMPVPNLGPSDFVVREDDVAREVLRVAPADARMQVAILVDNSEAARDAIADIRRALPDFVATMTAPAETGGRNTIALITLADRPTIQVDYTSDPAQLQQGIDRIFTQLESGLYLLDGLVEVSHGIKKREARRPVIVVLTTEGPEFSWYHSTPVLTALAEAGAALHAVVIGRPSRDISDEAQNRALVLAKGTRTSGGRYDTLLTSTALPGALKQLAAELTHQYAVTYARPQSLIPPERVTVSAVRPGLVARGTLVTDQRERGRP